MPQQKLACRILIVDQGFSLRNTCNTPTAQAAKGLPQHRGSSVWFITEPTPSWALPPRDSSVKTGLLAPGARSMCPQPGTAQGQRAGEQRDWSLGAGGVISGCECGVGDGLVDSSVGVVFIS